jgi:histidyl-tRNA synthetase
VFQVQELPVGGVLKLDFTLARGLNYYTGIIFEVTLDKTSIGSIAGGGRYDSLCNDIPCVGFSLGIDRLIIAVPNVPKSESMPQVWFVSPDTSTAPSPSPSVGLPVTVELPVTAELPVTETTTELDQTKSLQKQETLNLSVDKINEDIFKYRIGVMQCFRRAGIRAGTEVRQDLGLGAQLNYAIKNEIPYIAFIGQAEMHSGTVTIKDTTTRNQMVMTIEEAISMIK